MKVVLLFLPEKSIRIINSHPFWNYKIRNLAIVNGTQIKYRTPIDVEFIFSQSYFLVNGCQLTRGFEKASARPYVV